MPVHASMVASYSAARSVSAGRRATLTPTARSRPRLGSKNAFRAAQHAEPGGIETDQAGFIRHNGKLETNVPGVFVLGDVKGGPTFTHVAYDDYLVLTDNLVNGKNRSIDKRMVPYALYTDPELGRIGLSEHEARAKGYRLKIGSVPMAYVARAIERGETKGLMKIVINADNDRILGATILGPEGGELVQILMALMTADAPWTLFKDAMFIHPTLAEGFFSLMADVKAA
jgi:pyruvate/2-oxoglutarate dehydrogenase complex dihydrolipoamide dehydrogenase (E3) component